MGVLVSAVHLLHGQTVTYTGSPVNFGIINVCAEAATTPAPCRKIITLNYKVTEGGQFGTATVLTLGAFGGDFHPGSSTCTGNLTAGAACVVQEKFEPRSPGLHLGAVNIVDGSGNVMTTTFIRGLGIGPQTTFDGGLPNSWLPTRMPIPRGEEYRSMDTAVCSLQAGGCGPGGGCLMCAGIRDGDIRADNHGAPRTRCQAVIVPERICAFVLGAINKRQRRA
jgi:hypothetical protein